MMKLIVPFLGSVNKGSSLDELSLLLDCHERNLIGMVPWPVYGYIPDASFSIAYGSDCIFIKYYVIEKAIRAIYRRTNEPVYKDSCVEFFISFGDEEAYYNFEFNCAGTCLLGFGKNKRERKLLPEPLIRKIKNQVLLKTVKGAGPSNISWELTLMIPLDVFYHHPLISLNGQHCKVNFYKCGDELPEPHFLSWNDIKVEEPDFHLPEFFGEMQFST